MKKIVAFFLAVILFLSCAVNLAACTDKELAAYTGQLYTEIQRIKDGCSGIITIVHDDGNYETVEYMQKQFTRFGGLCASIAMIANNVVDADGNETSSAEKWRKIVKEGGFDIVCHTQSHSWYGFGDDGESGVWKHRDGYDVEYSFEPGHMTSEIAGAAERLRKVFSDSNQKVICFAIPGFPTAAGYNGRTDAAKEIIRDNFIAARYSGGKGVFDGVSVPCLNNLDDLNYQELNSLVTLTSSDYETEWLGYVDNAIEYGGWGIFLFHAIVREETDYEYSVARSKAERLFRYISQKVKSGEVWCATLTEAAQYTKEYQSATASISVSGKGISVSLHDELDDSLYDAPLTVKVQVMNSWTKAKVKYNGKKTEAQVYTDVNGDHYIYVDIIPDKGEAVITKG